MAGTRIQKTPNGPVLVVFGRHVHHGFSGCLLILVGALLAIHDLKDFPWEPRRVKQHVS